MVFCGWISIPRRVSEQDRPLVDITLGNMNQNLCYRIFSFVVRLQRSGYAISQMTAGGFVPFPT